MSVLGIVPARGGSKGIPGKNIKAFCGRPLIAYSVDAARNSGVIDRLIVSTDSEEIARVARGLGVEVPFIRPPELADDTTPMLPVLEHAVEALDRAGWSPEIIVLLQPTSPLRRSKRIREAIDLLRQTKADSVVTVVEVPRRLSPDYVMRMDGNRLVPFLPDGARITRRQDARVAYEREGSVYALWRSTLFEKRSVYGENSRPLVIGRDESASLDTPEDWDEAERRMEALLKTGCPL